MIEVPVLVRLLVVVDGRWTRLIRKSIETFTCTRPHLLWEVWGRVHVNVSIDLRINLVHLPSTLLH